MKRLALLLVAGCHATVTPDPQAWIETPTMAPAYDAGDPDGLGTDLGQVCNALRASGCPEGLRTASGRTCYQHLTALSAVVAVPVACVRGAMSPESVRICGAESTLRFRCLSKDGGS